MKYIVVGLLLMLGIPAYASQYGSYGTSSSKQTMSQRRSKRHVVSQRRHRRTRQVAVVIDNKVQRYSAAPRTVQGRVMVPIRPVFESLGATVNWNGATRTVVAVKGTERIELEIGNSLAAIGRQQVSLDTPPQLHRSIFYVPARFVGDSLGAKVNWQPTARRVVLVPGAVQIAGMRQAPSGRAQPPATTPPQPSQPSMAQPSQPGGSEEAQPSEPPGEMQPSEPSREQPSEPEQPQASPQPQEEQPAAPQAVSVTLNEWSVTLDPSTVPAGAIRLNVTNSGTMTHSLAIVGVKEKLGNVAPGGADTLTVTLQPGTYTVYCPIDGHRGRGMEAKLTVH